jgi:hypothetical protein
VLAEDNLNLAWDGTSLDAEHVNEVHINFSSDESLVLLIDVAQQLTIQITFVKVSQM